MNYGFHPEAEAEHLETIAHYESKRPGLGASYLAEFERVVSIVCQSPYSYPIEAQPDIHRVRMKQFPFSILFRIKAADIQILAVAHHRRRPRYWITRG